MSKIDELIKKLQEAREELAKNQDCYTGSTPNMAKDSRDPKLAPKEVKVKQLQAQVDNKTYKPDSAKIADKMLKDEALMMGEGCSARDAKIAKNGQWSMNKSAFKELEHKLEGEGKSEESAGAIAYTVGKKKYGKEGMEAKAKAGEAKKSESPEQEEKEVEHIFNENK